MNEEDIIDILENVFIFKNTNDKFTRLDLDAINGLLELYKQEKEKNKKLEEELNKFMSGEVFSANQAKYMEKQNKIFQDVIDLMIEGFKELKDDDEMYCTVPDDFCEPYKCAETIDCADCIRAYYFNKAKEKANDK